MFVHISDSWTELKFLLFHISKSLFTHVYVLPYTFSKFHANLRNSENWDTDKEA
jgi:hypothetical protein